MKVDADKVEGGDWIGKIPELDDVRLKVRGLQNAQFRRMQSRLLDAVPRSKRQGGRVDPEEMDRITSTCLAATVLIDWSGIEGEDGQPLPYSREKASELLTDPNFRRFRDGVIWAATQVGEDDAEADKDDAGNLQTARPGA